MRPKPLSKEKVLEAMRHTRSNRAAARYLRVSYQHYKPYAKLYKNEKTGVTLWDEHLNQCGKGIPKFLGTPRRPALDKIFSGEIDPAHFTPEKIRLQLIYENRLAEDCAQCGFNERRILDYKIPLLLSFKDGDKRNYKLENLEMVCYNCYFLYIGNVFTPEQIDVIEDIPKDKFKVQKPEFSLDDYQLENMRELGII